MANSSTIEEFSAFLSQLAEKSEYVYWLSSPDLKTIQYISPAYEKIWGRKLQELFEAPEKWITFLHPDDAEHHHPIHVMKERIEKLGPEARYNEDYRIIRPDGEVRWIIDRGFPIYNSQGNCLGITGVALDVTKEKQAELELAKAKIQAEAANRAKTEFLANMSHDVKTPLTGVIGMAELIAHDATGIERQRGEIIHSCGMQLLSFFNSCLELSKLEMLEWASTEEIFSLEILLEEIKALLFPTAQNKGLELTVEYDTTLPSVILGHRGSIYRVLLNLAGNALKFTQQGDIRIRAFQAPGSTCEKSMIGLEIRDTGIGIPKEKQGVIFEKLKRLTPSYEGKVDGHGIGLYIVDQYVKRMGGSIEVRSVVGKGSAFTVLLPMHVVQDSPVQEEPKKSSPSLTTTHSTPRVSISLGQDEEPPPQDAPHILLVEDNEIVQAVTKMLLNNAGFEVDIAGTGAEAVELFSPGKYGLIYMDIGLPDIDGYVVTQKIREKEKTLHALRTPIVALTGHGAVDVQAFCGEAGMQGVLSKPISSQQIKDVWRKYGKGEEVVVEGLTLLVD